MPTENRNEMKRNKLKKEKRVAIAVCFLDKIVDIGLIHIVLNNSSRNRCCDRAESQGSQKGPFPGEVLGRQRRTFSCSEKIEKKMPYNLGASIVMGAGKKALSKYNVAHCVG